MTQIERLLAVLSQNQVSFALIGGLAANAHGSAQLTFDVDVCYERTPGNIQRLCNALEPFHPYLRGAPAGLPFRFDPQTVTAGLNFTLVSDLGDLICWGKYQVWENSSRLLHHRKEWNFRFFCLGSLT